METLALHNRLHSSAAPNEANWEPSFAPDAPLPPPQVSTEMAEREALVVPKMPVPLAMPVV
jgi:hypothetical protein